MLVVGLELVTLGMYFSNYGSIHNPVPGLIISMGIYVELVQECLYISLVIYIQKAIIKVLSEVQILVNVSIP